MARFWKYLGLVCCSLVAGCGGPDADYTIIVVPKGLTHEHWQSLHRGADRCAADFVTEGVNVRVIFDGPLRERDAMEQIRTVDRRVATRTPGRTGIVLAPQHSKTMTACVKRADEAGVPVVIIDSDLVEKDHYVKYVATDNERGGYLAGEYLIRELKKQGKDTPRLVLFRYAVGSESTEQREKGFERAVRELCPDAVWLSNDKYAGATRDSAKREAGPLVLQFKDQIDGIFAANESSTSGMLDALKSQGLNKRVLLMGFDSSKPLLDAIREGDVIGSILQDPYRMGYVSTWDCVRHLQGQDVNAGRTAMSLSTGEYLVTRDNMDSLLIRGLFDPQVQAERSTASLRHGPEAKP